MSGKRYQTGFPLSTGAHCINRYLRPVITRHLSTGYWDDGRPESEPTERPMRDGLFALGCVPYILIDVAIAEKALIAQIRRRAKGGRNSAVVMGIGDDCAVLRVGRRSGRASDVLVTTDFSLEGVHFRREWHSAESIGHRCLARGL